MYAICLSSSYSLGDNNFVECDNDWAVANACETSGTACCANPNLPTSCGTACIDCATTYTGATSLDSTTPWACTTGTCVPQCSVASGKHDCDLDPTNGCESSVACCGGSDHTIATGCSLTGAATYQCTAGQCDVLTCAPPLPFFLTDPSRHFS